MLVVIHTPELEPITVVDIPPDHYKNATDRGEYTLQHENHFCKIWPVPVANGYLFITQDEEAALALPPSWLSGQRKVINETIGTLRKLKNTVIKLRR